MLKIFRVTIPAIPTSRTLYCKAQLWFGAREIFRRVVSGNEDFEPLWRTGIEYADSVPEGTEIYYIGEWKELLIETAQSHEAPKPAKRKRKRKPAK